VLVLGGCAADVATSTAVTGGEAGEAPLERLEAASTVPEAVCAAEVRTIEVAVEAYQAVEGAAPTDVGDLVPAYLSETPRHHDVAVTAAGVVEIVPAAGAGCD